MKIVCLLLIILFTTFVGKQTFATTYTPISLTKQLEEASGVIHATYLGHSYKKLSNDTVVTDRSFKIIKSALPDIKIVNSNNFKITYPGGKWLGIVHHVEASPKFKLGEEYIVLVKKGPRGFGPVNLGLDKYNIKKRAGKTWISSSVFPNHKTLGQINYNKFLETVSTVYGVKLEHPESNKFVFQKEKKNNIDKRSPASMRSDQEEKQRSRSLLWPIIALILLGASASFFIKERKRQ